MELSDATEKIPSYTTGDGSRNLPTSNHYVLVGKPEGMRPVGRPRRRSEDNIRVDLQEVECGVWTGLGWLRIETGGEQL
jgi:hypothetical protein